MLFSDDDKPELCEIMKMKERELPRRCVYLKHGNLQHVGAGWKVGHRLWYHLYVILEDGNLKDGATCVHGDWM